MKRCFEIDLESISLDSVKDGSLVIVGEFIFSFSVVVEMGSF